MVALETFHSGASGRAEMMVGLERTAVGVGVAQMTQAGLQFADRKAFCAFAQCFPDFSNGCRLSLGYFLLSSKRYAALHGWTCEQLGQLFAVIHICSVTGRLQSIRFFAQVSQSAIFKITRFAISRIAFEELHSIAERIFV